MAVKKNPLKLNPLQLRTLTVLQILARVKAAVTPGPNPGEVTISRFPPAHGDHVHLGEFVIATRDMTGLHNEAVWNALTRKNLARGDWPHAIVLTPEGLAYETGLGPSILKRAPH